MSNYIYIGQYFHKHGKDLQELGITEKKIGRTNNIKNREKGLNSTKMTIGYTIVAAWEVEDMNMVETLLHTAFDDNRLSGEWFDDVNDDLVQRVRKMLSISNLGKEIDLGDGESIAEKTVMKKAKSEFTVHYNAKIYSGSGSQQVIDVCNDLISDGFEVTPENSDLTFILEEPQIHPVHGDRTRELINGMRVVTHMGNSDKKKCLERLANKLGANVSVDYVIV